MFLRSMYSVFRHQVDRAPGAPALSDEHKRLTYGELYREAGSLSQEMIAQGLETCEPVAIVLEPGANQVICQLAAILARAICFPLDPGIPQLRLQGMLQRAKLRYVISCTRPEGYEESSDRPIRTARGSKPVMLYRYSQPRPANRLDPKVCHLLHTSGSTGEPKIVQITGDAILHLASSTKITPLRPDDKTVFVNDANFDLALFEVWVTLLSGAEIVVADKDMLINGRKLMAFFRDKKITVAVLSTGHFNLLAFSNPETFSPLRVLVTGGSIANTLAMGRVLQSNPPEQLWNAYGPTEATSFVTLHQVDRNEAEKPSIAIGEAIGAMQVRLFHPDRRRAASGEVGEICISGPGLSLGYLGSPEENEKSFFVADDEDVCNSFSPVFYKTGDLGQFRQGSTTVLEYIGRMDRQVKHNGYRVELAEIETVMKQSNEVLDAHVVHMDSPNNRLQKVLVACILPRKPDDFEPRAVRDFCRTRLPSYMLPNVIVPLDRMPLNSRGKIDRNSIVDEVNRNCLTSLSEIPSNGQPGTPLRDIWADVLGIFEFRPDDDFFSLGASSLQAAQLTVKIKKTFGRTVSLREIYEHSRFDVMTQYICLNAPTSNNELRAIIKQNSDLVERMRHDALIADNLTSPGGSVKPWNDADGAILLTGATGFVGAFFLHHLLQVSGPSSAPRIICLVRSQKDAPSETRLQKALEKYELWDPGFRARIQVIDGSFSADQFGLNGDAYELLADSVDAVFHFGAHVNFCQRYEEHFADNVLGTKNVVHFAGVGRPKSIHYASTNDVWGATSLVNGTKSLLEDESLDPHIQGPIHDTGYSQSQWVAEKLMRRARNRGFAVAIYRLGTVICDSKRRVGNHKDFFARVLVGCAKLGRFPLIEDLRWEYVTVDYVCQAIHHISRSMSNLGKSYSIVSPDPAMSVSLKETCTLLIKAGFPVERVPYGIWVKSLETSRELSENPLLALMPLIREQVLGELTRVQTSKNTPLYRTDNTREALKDAKEICYTPLDSLTIRGMFEFWVRKGYHDIPGA
ncbi:hypothetical protein CDD83_2134 [Cordyceps sp. RAO-2017]|nr:hypothetical protein CDD83_2134 [Cordyceps sp. RAO-2017]